MPVFFLSVSIVVFRPNVELLNATLLSLHEALESTGQSYSLWIIDNGAEGSSENVRQVASIADCLTKFRHLRVLSGHGNVGYGAGHNIAIAEAHSEYHLILNPDVELSGDSLNTAISWMGAHPEFGLLAPRVTSPAGAIEFLCRRYPSVWVLFLRGFAPQFLRRLWRNTLENYEMREVISREDVVADPMLVSGCFMFFRTALLRELGGFDPRYFLYFEDYDLSLRTARKTRLAYVPFVRIVHHGGNASKKGIAHITMFVRSARLFFSTHGWQFC